MIGSQVPSEQQMADVNDVTDGNAAADSEDVRGICGIYGERSFHLSLEGFAGPLDLLLVLARKQKVDLAGISILALADQFLGFLQGLTDHDLEIGAEYLAMAAWLAYLKSRLLLPYEDGYEEETDPAEEAEKLRGRIQLLGEITGLGRWIERRPRLGTHFFSRGEIMEEPAYTGQGPGTKTNLREVLFAFGRVLQQADPPRLSVRPSSLYAPEDALSALGGLVGDMESWQSLFSFLPKNLQPEIYRRSACAAWFGAALERASTGHLQMRQAEVYGPIYVRNVPDEREEVVS